MKIGSFCLEIGQQMASGGGFIRSKKRRRRRRRRDVSLSSFWGTLEALDEIWKVGKEIERERER
jgi:hypothetical protein